MSYVRQVARQMEKDTKSATTGAVNKVAHYIDLLGAVGMLAKNDVELSTKEQITVLQQLTAQLTTAKVILMALSGNYKPIDSEITRFTNALVGEDHKNVVITHVPAESGDKGE